MNYSDFCKYYKTEEELQALGNKICLENNQSHLPKIKLKHNRKGYTTYSTGHISIPIWAIQQGEDFLRYYLIHEVTHWILKRGHCQEFKDKEKEILSRYGLTVIYSRVYAKVLLKNNQEVWKKSW